MPPAHAGEQPNLLVMGEDADCVARHARIINRVLRVMESEPQAAGVRGCDGTAVSMGIADPGRVRRTDAEILSVGGRVQDLPTAAVTVFQTHAAAEQTPHADIMDLRARVSERLLNVRTGRALANYEISYGPGDLPPLPVSCNRDGGPEHVGDQARRIGAGVANVVATHLDFFSPAAVTGSGGAITGGAPLAEGCTGLTTGYQITLRHFDSAEISRIEEYLVSFRGYDHHRPMRSGATETTFWYESCSEVARLTRNLRLMTEHMDVEAHVRMTGNRFEIDRIRRPQQRNWRTAGAAPAFGRGVRCHPMVQPANEDVSLEETAAHRHCRPHRQLPWRGSPRPDSRKGDLSPRPRALRRSHHTARADAGQQ